MTKLNMHLSIVMKIAILGLTVFMLTHTLRVQGFEQFTYLIAAITLSVTINRTLAWYLNE